MKALTIALKDTLTRFRDPRGLLYMLLTPLVIGLIMGAAFSGQNDGSSPIYAIPVAIVNEDQSQLGNEFLDVLAAITVPTAAGEQPLFALRTAASRASARQLVEGGEVRAAIFLPAGMTAALSGASIPHPTVEVLTDPAASVSPLVVESVVQRIVLGFVSAAHGAELAAAAAREQGATPIQLEQLRPALAAAARQQAEQQHVQLIQTAVGAARNPNPLNYFMPSMAIFFLMFSVFASTRSILDEEALGTLLRLMTTPTSRAEILGGKIGGALLTGLMQMGVLVLVTRFFFGVDWGEPLGLGALTLVTVLAAAGLGALTAAFARDGNQAGLIGSLISLVFAVLGGNFIPLQTVPAWLDRLSKVTINRWALDGFVVLGLDRGGLADIRPHLAALLGMSLAFFLLSLLGFNRRFVR